jgi:apolipoprotein N-acyltransferase
MAIALLVGATWIHIDYLVIIFVFFLIGLVPLLGFVFMLFLIVFIGEITKKQAQSRMEGLTGMTVIFILVVSPSISTRAVDRFNKYRGNALIE